MKVLAIYILLVLISYRAFAFDPHVELMGDSFVSKLPQTWSVKKGDWKYFDVEDCFVNGVTCFGNNPTSPYGFPLFAGEQDGADVSYFKMNSNEAIVIFLRTPPQMKYFGFTQYLYSLDDNPKPIFASLSDTLNHLQFKVGRAPAAFDAYSVVVWTADMKTLEKVKTYLYTQGISDGRFRRQLKKIRSGLCRARPLW